MQNKITGLVTYSPRQSKTSFLASKDEIKKYGIEFKLMRFSKWRKNTTQALYDDIRLVLLLLFRNFDFAILNSGASLMERPRLLRILIKILNYRRIPSFLLWRNAAEKFAKIEAKAGNGKYKQMVKLLSENQHLQHLTISPQTSQDVTQALGLSKAVCIGNCQKMPAEYNISKLPESPPIVLNVASVMDRKGPDLFIKIAAAVCQHDKKVKFIWIGGAARPQEIDLIERYGLRERVEFRAFMPSPYDWMVKSSVFLFPSRAEGFGLAAAEAMACYRTVCCFEGTGAQHAVGDTGVIIPAFDVEAAAAEIRRLLHMPREKMINYRARERYDNMFSPAAYAAGLSTVIRASN